MPKVAFSVVRSIDNSLSLATTFPKDEDASLDMAFLSTGVVTVFELEEALEGAMVFDKAAAFVVLEIGVGKVPCVVIYFLVSFFPFPFLVDFDFLSFFFFYTRL